MMTIVQVNCIVCGKKFSKELRNFIRGYLEICDDCRSERWKGDDDDEK